MRSDGLDPFKARLDAPHIAVLGPVAVGRGSALQQVGGRAGRLLLGLAASVRPCSIELLTDVVWGSEPPTTYRAALHVHLGTLRRLLLEHGGGCRIARRGDGYVLELDGWEVDSTLAVDLLTAARAALDARPEAALELVAQALQLWRGAPFAVDGEVVDIASWHQFEAVRRDAEELHIEALLATGQAPDAETAALRAVGAEPLRENRWGQLLRARFLAGRTADALATYQEARTTLIDKIGMEPGPDLQGLEAAALTHDTARLRLPQAVDIQLRTLPAATGALVGRDRDVRRVAARVAGGHRVAIIGSPGVGKSRLALEVARQRGTDAAAWVDLREPGQALTSAHRQRTIDWARKHDDGLIVFDNAEVATSEVCDTIRDLAHRSPTVGVIATSRVPLDIDGAVEVLGPLELPQPDADAEAIESAPAVQLLRAALAELAPGATVPSGDAAALARRAGGLPLVLRLTAAAARALTSTAMVALPPSVADDDIDRATRAALRRFSDEVASAFADLSALIGEFDADLGARVAGVPPDRFSTVLIGLVDHGLVQAHPDRSLPYSMLEPIRAVAARLLDESGRRELVLDRQVDACIERARRLEQGTTELDAAGLEGRLAEDMPRHRCALEHLAQIGDAERALTLVCRLERPMYSLGWWAEKTELFDVALAIPGAPSTMRARAHAFRARPGPMHLLDVRHAERAEEMAESIGHPTLAAFARSIRSLDLWWSGHTGEAVELARAAADVFAAAGRTFEWCEARKFLGVALVLHGEPRAGLEIQRDTLVVVRREFTAPFHVAHNLSYLGHCHRLLGDDTAAHADWSEAHRLSHRIHNRGTAIHIAIGLADIAVDRGDHEVALRHVGEALDLIQAARAWTYATWAWTVAMRAHSLAGDIESAMACARRAVDSQAEGPSGESVRLAIELAHIAVERKDLAAAARLLGFVAATPDLRELPFPSPAEHRRRAAIDSAIVDGLGPKTRQHAEAGRLCTLAEAAGGLLIA